MTGFFFRTGDTMSPMNFQRGCLIAASMRLCRLSGLYTGLLLVVLFVSGCAHYPVNQPLDRYNPDRGYRLEKMDRPGNSRSLLVIVTFSGGGTRAAAFSYGVLEELARTEIWWEGRQRRLLDEVDVISAVSGGSFTAAYYGLFGDRIFEEFEGRFLKKNIQRALMGRVLNPLNWLRLASPNFDRSDLAAEYYDEELFGGRTFGDIAARGGPVILINATDMTLGTWFSFCQEQFDSICSDVSRFPVARAVAASSAAPAVLSPVTLRNYAGSCGYETPQYIRECLKERPMSRRRFQQAVRATSYTDAQKRPYVHLLDGGLADNLGLRAIMDRITFVRDPWSTLQMAGLEETCRGVFFVVNAETEPDIRMDQREKAPRFVQVIKATPRVSIKRYNFETVELLRESLGKWAEEIRTRRCGARSVESEAEDTWQVGPWNDIVFYLVEVTFDALPDESERSYLKGLPSSFTLRPETVDHLRDAAHRILAQSGEFQRLLRDLR
jgi:NTE family protein